MTKKIIIIGGGFFGLYLSEHFAMKGHRVILVEKGKVPMARASFGNQARVHNGYHYPRSILTALRSRVSFPRFVAEFRDCVVSDFEKYYMVANPLGKVTAFQFRKFCERIGAPCEDAPSRIKNLVNPTLVEAVFSTVEYAFDSHKLRDVMVARAKAAGVEIRLETTAERVEATPMGLQVTLASKTGSETHDVDEVFNCTYSQINMLLNQSGLDLIPLKHEMTEMCLVDVPGELTHVGITVMCGPFFSVMPFPTSGKHSFSHVRYTPHYEWHDSSNQPYRPADDRYLHDQRSTAWVQMQKDAARYIPLLSECKYDSSIWEVKTILPRSETDDSRPILFKPNYGLRGFHCVMGGKIDNVYDAADAIGRELGL